MICFMLSGAWSSLLVGSPSSSTGLLVYSFCSRFNQLGDGIWLRNINRVAARNLDDCRASALGHKMLGRRRNHPVLGSDQVPTRLGLPRRLADRATERFDTPRHLRVGHERGF